MFIVQYNRTLEIGEIESFLFFLFFIHNFQSVACPLFCVATFHMAPSGKKIEKIQLKWTLL